MPSPIQPAPRNVEGAAWLVLTMTLFGLSDTAVKAIVGSLPVGEVMALRGAMIVPLLLAAALVTTGRPRWADLVERRNLVRAVLEIAIASCYFTALRHLPLAQAVTIVFASPIIMTVLAALWLGETVGPWRWSAVLVGFVGVVLIVQPTGDAPGWATLLAATAAVLVSVRDLMTRSVPRHLPPTTLALTTAIVVAVAGGLTLPFAWVIPSPRELALIGVSAALIAVAYVTIVVAYRLGEASFVAPFRYTEVPLTMLLGILVFAERPTGRMLLGTVIVVGAGLVIFVRERRLTRRVAATS